MEEEIMASIELRTRHLSEGTEENQETLESE
jgi:hypothetical protein